jgi:hypothetical protein
MDKKLTRWPLSITAWGDSKYGGSGAPDGNGYTKIYSNEYAFAALKADGSITAWGDSRYGGASNLPIKPLEQVKIAWLMLEIDCRAHQHGQKTYSVAI